MRLLMLLGTLVAAACGGAASEPANATVRLVSLFKPDVVSGATGAAATKLARTEWRFDKTAPEAADVTGAAVRDGRFAGRTTSEFPMFRIERTSDLDNRDQVHAIEVRMRVSAGANMSLITQPAGRVDFADLARRARSVPWNISTPLLPGPDLETYTLTPQGPLNMSRARQFVIRPTDAAAA